MDYTNLGYTGRMVKGLNLPERKTETQTGISQQDQSISLSKLTVGVLTGGTIQSDKSKNVGVKIVGKQGLDLYGTTIRFLDSSGNTGGTIAGLTSGGMTVYSTTGQIKIDSGENQLRLTYDTMRGDDEPTAEEITAADYYVIVNMGGVDYKLMLKSI